MYLQSRISARDSEVRQKLNYACPAVIFLFLLSASAAGSEARAGAVVAAAAAGALPMNSVKAYVPDSRSPV
jgi:hypothetical protein